MKIPSLKKIIAGAVLPWVIAGGISLAKPNKAHAEIKDNPTQTICLSETTSKTKELPKINIGNTSLEDRFNKPQKADPFNYVVKLELFQGSPTDPEEIVQVSTGVQLNVGTENIQGFISQERFPIRFGGQRGVDVRVRGIGVSINEQITDWLNIFIQGGYYFPDFKLNGKFVRRPVTGNEPNGTLGEGLWIYLGQHLKDGIGENIKWDKYSVRYSGNWGGRIGVDANKPITDSLSVGLSASYRYLRLEEYIIGQNDDFTNCFETGRWEYRHDRDFSIWTIGLNFKYKF